MKKIILFTLISLGSFIASAQSNYYQFSIGLSGGINRYFGDVSYKPKYKPSYSLSVDYNISPFSSAGIEIQKGTLSAGDSINEPAMRFFKNDYTAVIMGIRVQLGQFIDAGKSQFLNTILGVYIGTGVGMIASNQKEIKRTLINTEAYYGKDQARDLMIPANIGFNYPIQNKRTGITHFSLNVNYQFNFVLDDNIDGYNAPPVKFRNLYNDSYSNLTAGIKYLFGSEGIY